MQQNDFFFINDKARNHQNKEMIKAGNIQFIIFIIKSKSKIFICLATLSCCDLIYILDSNLVL